MSKGEVELVYFDGCPHADAARESLRTAVGEGGWREWNLSSDEMPDRLRRHGSPTILVDGRDVTGDEDAAAAMACRADGAPSAEVIRKALGGQVRPR